MTAYRLRLCASILALVCLSPVASSATIESYNLIVFGDLDSQSQVEGKTYVGGNLNGITANFGVGITLPQTEAALTVAGNINSVTANINAGAFEVAGDISPQSIINMNSNGAYAVGGTFANNINNGFQVGLTGIPSPAAVRQQYQDLSAQYANFTPNSVFNVIGGSQATFEASTGPGGLAVFNIASADLLELPNTVSQLVLNLSQSSGAIINISGTNISILSGLNPTGSLLTDEVRSKVVWNFYEAEIITVEASFNGMLLAPYADLTNQTAIDGQVVVESFTQRGAVHLPLHASLLIPEPSTAVLTLALLPVALFYRRKF